MIEVAAQTGPRAKKVSKTLHRSIDRGPEAAVPRIFTLGQAVAHRMQSGAELAEPKSSRDARAFSASRTLARSEGAEKHREERQTQATESGFVRRDGGSSKQALGLLLRWLRLP
jgi:hypothetical protein